METIPGVGLPVARVGWTRAQVESQVGPATSAEHGCLVWGRHSPPFAVQFDDHGVIVVEFDEGFTLWSLLSLTAADIDTDPASVGVGDGDQLVVEGVAIAPARYLAGR